MTLTPFAKSLPNHWYKHTWLSVLLLPVSWVYCALVGLRRLAYRSGIKRTRHLNAPLIVVGNLTVGGTGKTPLVIWLAERLRAAGYRPGIVCRGYGGQATWWPRLARADSSPREVGDEAVLLAVRAACPVMAGPNRVRSAQALISEHRCDVVISDDGLQHLALGRTVDVVVIDGERRFGNGHCLPAGPLREPAGRRFAADLRICNGTPRAGELQMQMVGNEFYRLGDPADRVGPAAFEQQTVHAIAGIGNSERYFAHLRQLGLNVVAHAFPDHHTFTAEDIACPGAAAIIMTEKDAVKCANIGDERHWVMPISAQVDEQAWAQILNLLRNDPNGQKAA